MTGVHAVVAARTRRTLMEAVLSSSLTEYHTKMCPFEPMASTASPSCQAVRAVIAINDRLNGQCFLESLVGQTESAPHLEIFSRVCQSALEIFVGD